MPCKQSGLEVQVGDYQQTLGKKRIDLKTDPDRCRKNEAVDRRSAV